MPSNPPRLLPLTAEEIQGHKDRRDSGKADTELLPAVPAFLRNPATAIRLVTEEEYRTEANKYFAHCMDNDKQPQLTELVLALGLPGVSSFHRLARRREDLREIFSRCITAIAAGYEHLLVTGGGRGAIFALKHLPDFDMEDPAGSPEIAFWTDKQSIEVTTLIPGVALPEVAGSDLTPEEAYIQIMRGGRAFSKHSSQTAQAKNPSSLDAVLAKQRKATQH